MPRLVIDRTHEGKEALLGQFQELDPDRELRALVDAFAPEKEHAVLLARVLPIDGLREADTTHQIYPQQKNVAGRLFKAIGAGLRGPGGGGSRGYGEFAKLVVCFLLPKFTSLFEQTKLSVQNFRNEQQRDGGYRDFLSDSTKDRAGSCVVIRATTSKGTTAEIKKFVARVKSEPKTLFLVVR